MIDVTESSQYLDPISKTALTESTKYAVNRFFEKVSKMRGKNKLEDQQCEQLKLNFESYLKESYIECSSIPTLALKGYKVSLENIYQPLTISLTQDSNIKFKLESYNNELFENYQKIVILDSAGMGKSTLSKYLFLCSLKESKKIPVFIELRRLKKDYSVLDEFYSKINPLNETKYFNKDDLFKLLEDGDFVFFLDGYDEISNSDRKTVGRELNRFITKAYNNTFIITSRPSTQLSFHQFDNFQLSKLTEGEAKTLIAKYDNLTNLNLSEELWSKIEERSKVEEGYIKEFLSNPLYLSLLYITYKNRKDLPLTQSSFYRRIYDALYEEHDFIKDSNYRRPKTSGLSRDDMDLFLQRFAAYCMEENMNDYSKETLLSLFNKTVDDLYYLSEVQPHDIFEDLIENVPLIIEVGGSYKWIHKSFMEYFASVFISKLSNKEKVLKNIIKSNQYKQFSNLLEIYQDIDRKTFDYIFIKPLLEEFINYIDRFDEKEKEKDLLLLSILFSKYYVFRTLDEHFLEENGLSFDREKRIKLHKHFKEKYPELRISSFTHRKGVLNYRGIADKDKFMSFMIDVCHSKKYNFVIEQKFRYNQKSNSKIYDKLCDRDLIISSDNYQILDIEETLELIGNIRSEPCVHLDYPQAKNYLKIIKGNNNGINLFS